MKSHEVTVGVYNTVKETVLYLHSRQDTTVAEREMFLTNVTWSPDEKHVYIAKLNREQNHMWLESYNVETGDKESVLFEEQNARYVEPCEGLYFLPGRNNEFLWFSERDGYKHLYHYKTDGTLVRQLTQGNYDIEGVIGFDAGGKQLFVYSNKDNAAGVAAYRVDMKTGAMTRMTAAEGTHSVSVSHDGSQFIDLWSSVSVPLKAEVRTTKGKLLSTLSSASNPLADYAMPTFSLGTIKAADGQTDLCYRLITPPHMDSTKQYPTLVYVYGGPHSQLVTDKLAGSANLYFTSWRSRLHYLYAGQRGTDTWLSSRASPNARLGTVSWPINGRRQVPQASLWIPPHGRGGWSFGAS